MKTSTILATIATFALGIQAAPTPDPNTNKDQVAVRFQASPAWDLTNCRPDAQPSERKYCRSYSFTFGEVEARNGQCTPFGDGSRAIRIEQFDAHQCKMVAYQGPDCTGNVYELGSLGMISVEKDFSGWKFVCNSF